MGHHTCCNKQKVRRGLWSPEEDEKLIKYISTYGHGCWSTVPRLAGLQRCGKSCRLRWINYLRPDLKRGSFSRQEELLIIELHRMIGNRWARIAKHLPGRTDNEVKNFWNSTIKKKLIARAVDGFVLPEISNPVPSPAEGLFLYQKQLVSDQGHCYFPAAPSLSSQSYCQGEIRLDMPNCNNVDRSLPIPPIDFSMEGRWPWDVSHSYQQIHSLQHLQMDDSIPPQHSQAKCGALKLVVPDQDLPVDLNDCHLPSSYTSSLHEQDSITSRLAVTSFPPLPQLLDSCNDTGLADNIGVIPGSSSSSSLSYSSSLAVTSYNGFSVNPILMEHFGGS